MENLLNLCWVLLAMAALLAWRCQAAHERAGQRGRLVALLCVMVLMFPVISATDDLHPAGQAIEDSSKRTQSVCATLKSVATNVKYGPSPAVLVQMPAVALYAVLVEWLRLTAAPGLQAVTTLSASWRAPPVLTF
jgi:hypothetical protein